MLVSKWGNSLAVRLPKRLVEALNLSPGDELNVVEVSKGQIAVEKVEEAGGISSAGGAIPVSPARWLQIRPR